MWNIYEEIITAVNILKINVVEISENQSQEIIKKIIKKYTTENENRYLWEEIIDYFSVNNKEAWQWINEFIGDSEAIMFFNNSDERRSFIFKNGDDLVSVLRETYGFEFYITNKDFSYLICFNHHDVLITSGIAKQWLKNKQDQENAK